VPVKVLSLSHHRNHLFSFEAEVQQAPLFIAVRKFVSEQALFYWGLRVLGGEQCPQPIIVRCDRIVPSMAEPSTTFIDAVSRIISAIISPRIAVTIFVVACILLAAPTFFPGMFPWLDTFIGSYKVWLVIAWMLSGVLSVTYAVSGGWSAIKKKAEIRHGTEAEQRSRFDRVEAIRARLAELTLEEKHILQEYIDLDSRTAQFNITSGRLDALCASRILRITLSYGIKGTYMISDEAWRWLQEHRHLIATPDNPRVPRSFYGEY
jgi:hypothetical protein